MRVLQLALSLFLIFQTSSARKFYVDVGKGKLGYTGTSDKPFPSIQSCVEALKSPGDQCIVKSGNYHEDIVINGKHGTKDKPITIKGFNQEKPTIDGTIVITPVTPWRQDAKKKHIYSAKIQSDISQLFIDGEMMTNARWPNSLWSDRSIFDGKYWEGLDDKSTRGRVVNKGNALAETKIDMTGAIAVLNIGSFSTYAARVESHSAGSNAFTYKDTFGDILYRPSKSRYFLEDKLELLDQPEEWYYNKVTKILYVWTKDGDSPQNHELRGKVQTYAMRITNCSNLVIKDIDFFATTFRAESLNIHSTIDNLKFQSINFKFPSYSKRMLGVTVPPEWTIVNAYARKNKVRKWGTFQFVNCTFFGTDGTALEYKGMNTTLKNNLFEYNDWTGAIMVGKSGGGYTVSSQGIADLFIRNTLRYNGASAGYRPGLRSTVKLNHVYGQCWGVIQNDGSGIHLTVDRQTNAKIEQNWAHSSPKYGLRFDGQPPKIGIKGTFKRNVVFKCNGLMVKGDYHTVIENLAFDKKNAKDGDRQGVGCTLCVLKYVRKNPGEINMNTVVLRNAADVANGGRHKRTYWPLAGKIVKDNVFGTVRDQLMDADNFDFRPAANSTYISYNAGPYKYSPRISDYWIPGRQMFKASTPVPPHNSSSVIARNRDALMWLNALGAKSHDVFIGFDRKSVEDATKTSQEYAGSTRGDSNVIYLKNKLHAKETYYWRVDAIVSADVVYKGDIWFFTTK